MVVVVVMKAFVRGVKVVVKLLVVVVMVLLLVVLVVGKRPPPIPTLHIPQTSLQIKNLYRSAVLKMLFLVVRMAVVVTFVVSY